MTETIRTVETPNGSITYHLSKKEVQRLNLRINKRGEVRVSIPKRCTRKQADAFVCQKSDWIAEILTRQRQQMTQLPPMPEPEECQRLLVQAVERVYPLVEGDGVAMPRIKLRKMTSQWGNCHWTQGYITLNTVLARCPREMREYVALHELVHFLHQDHGVRFYDAMTRRMPDWQARRNALRRYEWELAEK